MSWSYDKSTFFTVWLYDKISDFLGWKCSHECWQKLTHWPTEEATIGREGFSVIIFWLDVTKGQWDPLGLVHQWLGWGVLDQRSRLTNSGYVVGQLTLVVEVNFTRPSTVLNLSGWFRHSTGCQNFPIRTYAGRRHSLLLLTSITKPNSNRHNFQYFPHPHYGDYAEKKLTRLARLLSPTVTYQQY